MNCLVLVSKRIKNELKIKLINQIIELLNLKTAQHDSDTIRNMLSLPEDAVIDFSFQPIHFMCLVDNPIVLKYLITSNSANVQARTSSNMIPLHIAAKNKSKNCLCELIKSRTSILYSKQ